MLAEYRLWETFDVSKVEDGGTNNFENTEPATHAPQFAYLSPFVSFMLLFRNLLHLIAVLEIQSLYLCIPSQWDQSKGTL